MADWESVCKGETEGKWKNGRLTGVWDSSGLFPFLSKPDVFWVRVRDVERERGRETEVETEAMRQMEAKREQTSFFFLASVSHMVYTFKLKACLVCAFCVRESEKKKTNGCETMERWSDKALPFYCGISLNLARRPADVSVCKQRYLIRFVLCLHLVLPPRVCVRWRQGAN